MSLSRGGTRPWRGWYSLARWRHMRTRQLSLHPLCTFCLARDIVEPATVADHVTRHNGDPELFWDPDNLQSLCKYCHDSTKKRMELGQHVVQFDANGWPISEEA